MHLSSASHQFICLFSLVILLSAFTSGVTSHDHKRPTCCTKEMLTDKDPLTKIIECKILSETRKCVEAVVFTDKYQMYCIDPKAPWLTKRMKRLRKNGVACEDYTEP